MSNINKKRELLRQALSQQEIKTFHKDIAIIGLDGQYPGAKNPQQLWEMISNGENRISEVPSDRWDVNQYYEPDPQAAVNKGKMYCKWGGFIDDVYTFDPLFFNLSPKSAEMMDPQVRKLLETTWATFEDAGYKPLEDAPRDIGVFIGATTHTYNALLFEEHLKGRNIYPSANTATLATLISYFYNFTGPSLSLDTECSSSLTAIHLACKSLNNDECKMAVAGGINLYLHPWKYILLSQTNILSHDEKIRSFGKGGDGFVPGEGVGMVLLKPLHEAIKQGDYIYGVIKGSAINNWGKSSMYMAPNPKAQAELIAKAVNDANIAPETISYIEAQGMGSDLADCAEISCLNEVYGRTKQCPIGSIKPNIGHPEAASGIAQLTKVLLQFKHKKIAPSLNSEETNPNIDFDNSPFYLQHGLSEWKQPIIREKEQWVKYRRRAGISAFASGGTGAHIIVEEFDNSRTVPKSDTPVVITISARDKERLKENAKKLIDYLKNSAKTSSDLQRIAYTLQTGRVAMQQRLAVVVSETAELIEKLEQYCQGMADIENCYSGDAKQKDKTLQPITQALENNLLQAASQWVTGTKIDWRALYTKGTPLRIPLPTYSFAKETYVVQKSDQNLINQEKTVQYSFDNMQEWSIEGITKLISDLFIEVLGLDKVEADANFFDFGGHSITGTFLSNQISRIFKIRFEIKDLYENPTPGSIAQIILKTEKLFEWNLIEDSANRYEPFAFTDIQYAYWIGRQGFYAGGNVACHAYLEADYKNLEVLRLEKAVNLVIERHGMLRVIITEDGMQQIRQNVPHYDIAYKDMSKSPQDEITRYLQKEREALSHQVLDVAKGELFLFKVVHLPDRYRLYIGIDLLIMDALSVGIFFSELGKLYSDPDLKLAKPAMEFRDYVMTMEALKKTPQYLKDKTYWIDRIDSLPLGPQLPLKQNLSTIDSPRFCRVRQKIAPELWSRIKAKAKNLGVTDTSILLLIFGKVIAKWSTDPSFLINLTLFGRLPFHDQIENTIGDFTTIEIFEFNNEHNNKTFAQEVSAVHHRLMEDIAHNLFTGVDVLREMAKKNTGIDVVAPVVLTSLLNMDMGTDNEVLKEAGYIETLFGISQTPQVWIDNKIFEEGNHLIIEWDYNATIFPDNMVAQMHEAFCQLLEKVATNRWEENIVCQYFKQKRYEPIEVANATQDEVSEQYLHTLFKNQAKKHPDFIAVISEDTRLTYKALYELAARIGNGLKKVGARPNSLVAVVMNKGWEQIAAVMGILNSGAAYLPINATYPQERIKNLLKIGEVEIVLTQPDLLKKNSLPDNVMRYEITTHSFANENAEIKKPVQSLDDIAYVIFTSGSTGTPKGVMINHRSAVNTILDINRRFDVTSQDRILALSALNFDLSVYDIFGMLAVGGSIVVPVEDVDDVETGLRDPSYWVELMTKNGVTLWNTVPALMHMMVEYLAGNALDVPLRLVMMSGDWIPLDLPDRIQKIWHSAVLVSLGGATEASIWSNSFCIETVKPEWRSIPYGKPLTNQFFHILDQDLESCPIFVPGRLYIGGIGLAKGYWRDEEKTNAAFIKHPHSGERLYKTGDLGRYLPDGNIEFLGREDFQVKIQGNRIELGEVENHLIEHPDIKEAVVTAVGENRHNKQLAAYIVPVEGVKTHASYGTKAMQGVLTDPKQRLQFKLAQHGYRQFTADMPSVDMSCHGVDNTAYLARQSYREFSDKTILLSQLAQLLSCLSPRLFADAIFPKYQYGSAGNLYPIQTYIYIKADRITNLAQGLYYYHPINCELILLSSVLMDREQHGAANKIIFDRSAFSLFLVAEYKAIEPMYGSDARDFCLLEAGYMTQLLMMEAPNIDLGLCPIGGMNFDPLREALGLSDTQEMVHSLLGGGILVEQKAQLKQIMPQAESDTEAVAGEPLEQRLKAWLNQKLPSYMVPSTYVVLSNMPLTANGKIDRQALPVSQPDISRQTAQPATASNELENALVQLIQKQLDVESINVDDDFFDLGANSLDMIKLYNEIKAKFQHDLTIADVFGNTTAKKLAEFLSKTPKKKQSTIPQEQAVASLDPEQIDRLAANLDNLSDEEVSKLLDEMAQK